MKLNFKTLLLAIVFAILAPKSFSQTAPPPVKLEYVYEFHDKTSNAVVATPFKDFTGIGKKNYEVMLYAFAGVDNRGKALSGFNLEVPVKVANELTFQAGPAWIMKLGDKGRFGFYLGFQLK